MNYSDKYFSESLKSVIASLDEKQKSLKALWEDAIPHPIISDLFYSDALSTMKSLSAQLEASVPPIASLSRTDWDTLIGSADSIWRSAASISAAEFARLNASAFDFDDIRASVNRALEVSQPYMTPELQSHADEIMAEPKNRRLTVGDIFGILSFLLAVITLIVTLMPNNQLDRIVTQNDEIIEQNEAIIENQQKVIDLQEEDSDLIDVLNTLTDTINLLNDELDVLRDEADGSDDPVDAQDQTEARDPEDDQGDSKN